MIPLKLELKNFLSYGDGLEPISFKDHSLICFSGKNGNGKSALLDAITWSIWGQARKISGTIKPDAGLLRLGQTRMVVSLEFEFSKNIYRVRREFAKTYGKPYLALDLDVFDSTKEKFVSLTDKTVRLTQQKIEKLLGLDYDTFVNSAFLRQGMADEFSKKSPKERKQILANILGFSKYNDLQGLAADKVKQFVDEKKLTEQILEQAVQQTKKDKELQRQLDEQKKTIKTIDAENIVFQRNLLFLQKEKNDLLQKKQKKQFLDQEKNSSQKRIRLKTDFLSSNVYEWKKVHYKTLNMLDVQLIEEQYKKLSIQEKDYLSLQQKSLMLQEQVLQKKERYQKEFKILKDKSDGIIYEEKFSVEKMELLQKQVVDNLKQKEKRLKELQLKINNSYKELFILESSLKKNQNLDKQLESNKQQFDKRRSFYQILIQKGNWIKAQVDEVEVKKKTIKSQDSPSCPLCNQVLTLKRKQFLGSKFLEESGFLKRRFLRVSNLIKKLKDILVEQHDLLKKIEKEFVEHQQLIAKKQELEKNITSNKKELEILGHEISKDFKDRDIVQKNCIAKKQDLEKKIKAAKTDLKNNSIIKLLSDHIKVLEQDRFDLKYDKNIHAKLQSDIKDLENSLKELDLLKKEREDQKTRRNTIVYLIVELKDLKKILYEIEDKIKKLNFDTDAEKILEQKIIKLREKSQIKLKDKETVLQEIGSLENELKRINALKLENEKRKLRLEFLKDQIEEYKLLVYAFGKDGIQALLIEQVIPQIEEEANNILARLTDNQAQVFIESLRDLKKGGVKETLDIQISDSAGIRPYEMFSGGEAFRVDFALRIAISKLLARRSGTALQTLIIDEGFGSQDEEGLSRLMDAIYLIQEDFSKVIVVSHLASFKENFPVHFLIEKNAAGSFIRVQERG